MVKLTPEQEAEGKQVFEHLKQKIADTEETYRDHWEWIGNMQTLANRGVTAHFAERDRWFRESVTDAGMLHG